MSVLYHNPVGTGELHNRMSRAWNKVADDCFCDIYDCLIPYWRILDIVMRSVLITACKRSLPRLCFYTCLSVQRGVCLSACWDTIASRADPPGPGTPPPAHCMLGERSTSGRYASYWNATLLITCSLSRLNWSKTAIFQPIFALLQLQKVLHFSLGFKVSNWENEVLA